MGVGLTTEEALELRSMNAAISGRMTFIGVDLGQRVSNTAIVILEQLDVMPDYTDMLRGIGKRRKYVVRQAERMALGTPYPEVVMHLKRLVERVNAKRGSCTLVVDGSGVGIPVVEMMYEVRMGCQIMAYTITSGQQA